LKKDNNEKNFCFIEFKTKNNNIIDLKNILNHKFKKINNNINILLELLTLYVAIHKMYIFINIITI
jgi:hypothetical protein